MGTEGKDQYEAAAEDKNSLGNILLDLGYISSDDLEKAIRIQRSQMKLGQILVRELEVLTEEQLEEALVEQRIRQGKARHRETAAHYSQKKKQLVRQIETGLDKLATTLGAEEAS